MFDTKAAIPSGAAIYSVHIACVMRKLCHAVTPSVLYLLFLTNVYDPGGALQAKYAAYCIAFICGVLAIRDLNLSSWELCSYLLLFVAWPIWAFLMCAVKGGDVNVGLTQVTPFLFILPLAPLLQALGDVKPLRLFYAVTFSLAIVMLVSMGLALFFPGSTFTAKLVDLLSGLHEREGYFGTMTFGDWTTPVFYFRSTLFLVPTSVYYLFRRKIVRALLATAAVGLAWSKSGIAIILVFGLIYFLSQVRQRRVEKTNAFYPRSTPSALLPFGLLVGVVILILFSFPGFYEYALSTVAGGTETAEVRIGHYHSLLSLFESHPHYLLFGQGVGVPFFSSGESGYVQAVEIDHLDAIRKFGVLWFVGFSAVVFFSARNLIVSRDSEQRASGFALISMYIAAGTNPVLVSPLFIILMTLCFFEQRQENEHES